MLNLFNPTNDDRELRAIQRNEDDAALLRSCAEIVQTAQDELISHLHPLRHPDRRWSPEDLMQVLSEQMIDIRSEQERLRGPLVLDDES